MHAPICARAGSKEWMLFLATTLWLGCSGQQSAIDDWAPSEVSAGDASVRGGRDRQPPTVPTGLFAAVVSCTQANLSWNASTDVGTSGLSGYRLYRNGAFVQQVASISASESALSPSTSYQYAVSAYDRAGNESAKSSSVLVNMPACPPPPANAPPIANAGPDQTALSLTPVAFSGAASTDSDGTLVSYSWSFGDGVAGSGVSVGHSYAAPGTFIVTLTVQDNSGNTASDSAVVTVTNRPPVVNAGPDKTSLSLTAVGFDSAGSSDPDGSIISFAWNFGDGVTASGATASHSFAAPGTYTVTLTVTDNSGATGRDTAIVTVTNRAPVANAGVDQTAAVNTAVTFAGTGSDADGTVASYSWSFGDGASAVGASVTHAYAAAGTYTATLTVTDNLGATASDTAQATITAGGSVPTLPNDPEFQNQWALASIRMVESWAATTATRNVKVAILSTGVTSSLADLQGVLGPGYNAMTPGGSTEDDFGTYGMGTMLAGVIGARTGNGLGVAGIARNVTVLPVKIADFAGYVPRDNVIAAAMNWAVSNGAQIILESASVDPPVSVDSYYTLNMTPEIQAAVAGAISQGVLVVTPSGNGRLNELAKLPGVIGVRPVDPANVPGSYTVPGDPVDLVAPGSGGVDVLTKIGCCITSLGTETAHVAGALALLLESGVPAAQAPSVLFQGAKDLGASGWDQAYGWGELDICGALAAAGKPCPTFTDAVAPSAPSTLVATGYSSCISLAWTNSTDNVGVTGYEVYRDGVLINVLPPNLHGATQADSTATSGQHCYFLKARDAAGKVSSASNTACATKGP